MKRYLAFDLGASSGRAVVGELSDGRIRIQETHRFTNGPVSVADGLYWNILRLFEEMKHGLKLAVSQYGDVESAGIDSWGVDYGLLGPGDVLLDHPRHYRDSRTDGMVEEAARLVTRDRIHSETGIQIMQINTLFQLLACAKSNPWQLDSAKSMLMIPDLLAFWFTGEKTNEFTNATTTQMFNPRNNGWATDLLNDLGIPTHFLGSIIQPGATIGSLRPSIAQEIGAPSIRFIAPATHDTGSAVAAVPAEGTDHVYISSGTWSLVGIETKDPIIDAQSAALNFTNEGGIGGYRFLKNVVGLWLLQECMRVWSESHNNYSYGAIIRMAESAEPYSAVIDPDDPVFLKPGDMPSRIRDYCKNTGQRVPEDNGTIARVILESLALKYRYVIECLESITTKTLGPVHVVGGGSQNRMLCQLTADATGKTVIAGPVEATAIGNVLVQAIGLGHISGIRDARRIVRDSFELEAYGPRPDDRIHEAYNRLKKIITNSNQQEQ